MWVVLLCHAWVGKMGSTGGGYGTSGWLLAKCDACLSDVMRGSWCFGNALEMMIPDRGIERRMYAIFY